MNVDAIGDIYFYCGTVDGSSPWMDAHPKLGWMASNFVRIPTKTPIYDLRGKEHQFKIDVNGFEAMNYDGQVHLPFDDNSDEQTYFYKEIIQMMKSRFDASSVIVFNHIIRSRWPPRPADQCDDSHKNPVFYPHVDHNSVSAHSKLKEIVGEEEATKRLRNRFQIVNVWKPLGPNSITNIPLSICDYQTFDLKNDIHVSEARSSVNTTSVLTIPKSIKDQQRWYYLRNMKSNEMLVFKMFDSNASLAQFGAHTAFVDESAPQNNLEQSSVELRCLVFYD